jgi:hypothetical protein
MKKCLVDQREKRPVCERAVCEGPVCEGPVCEGPVCEGPLCEGPDCEGPVYEGPVCEGPVCEGPLCEGQACEEPIWKCEGPVCTANKFGIMYSRIRISQNSFPNFNYIFTKSFMIFCQELQDPKRNYENQI